MRIQYTFPLILLLVKLSIQDSNESFCKTPEGENGVCISLKTQIKYCEPLHKLLKTREWQALRQSICSSDNTRVCCSLNNYNETILRDKEPNYKDHKNFKLLPTLRECGQLGSTDRILGGNRSQPGEHPFVVRIGVQADDDSHIQYACGGSLISKRYVLTAAHCLKAKVVEVVLGQTDEDLEEECIKDSAAGTNIVCAKSIKLKPMEIISHPNYTKKVGSENDIALIRLPEDINITTPFTRPICLPFLTEYQAAGKLGDTKILRDNNTWAAGWGKTNNVENVGSTTLQVAPIPIQPTIMCRITYSSFHIGGGQICAGGVEKQDSCLGDSGGPLFSTIVTSARFPRTFQLGIVSYGKTICGRGNEPVVYTRLRSYLSWILDNMKE